MSAETTAEELSNLIVQELLELMDQQGIRPSDLAKGMEKSRADIAGLLRPGRNFTLLTLCKIADGLGYFPVITFKKLKSSEK